MMKIILNVLPQHFIPNEIRRVIKHIQTFGAALKNCFAIVLIFDNKMDFTAIMIPQKINQPT